MYDDVQETVKKYHYMMMVKFCELYLSKTKTPVEAVASLAGA